MNFSVGITFDQNINQTMEKSVVLYYIYLIPSDERKV